MENNKKVGKAAGTVGLMTMISRLFGFVRDLVIAMTFGASASADAFFVAFRIPNIQRRILGEGAVSAAMIPVYGEYLNTKSEEETQAFASNLFNIQLAVLILTSLGIVVFAPYLIMGFAHSIWVLVIGRLLAGASGATQATVNAYIADISPPEKRSKNMGLIGMAFGLGFIFGPALGSWKAGGILSQMAGAIWNHGPEMWTSMDDAGIEYREFEEEEMSDLMTYLYFTSFFDPPGDVARGEGIFEN